MVNRSPGRYPKTGIMFRVGDFLRPCGLAIIVVEIPGDFALIGSSKPKLSGRRQHTRLRTISSPNGNSRIQKRSQLILPVLLVGQQTECSIHHTMAALDFVQLVVRYSRNGSIVGTNMVSVATSV